MKEKRTTQGAKKKLLIGVLVAVCVCVLAAAAWLFAKPLIEKSLRGDAPGAVQEGTSVEQTTGNPAREDNDGDAMTYFGGKWYTPRKNLQTVLVMGVDKYEDDESVYDYVNQQQADFWLLLVLDPEREVCMPLQLNRDTMTEIQVLGVNGAKAGTVQAQLALAHTYGTGEEDSSENAVLAASTLLYNTKIDHYLTLKMDAVPMLNDAVGGVTLEVLDDFSRVDETLVQGKTVTLKGDQTLTYVRSRMEVGDGTNLSRMKRQQQYLDGLYAQVMKALSGDENFLMKELLEISQYMVSDCTIRELSDLLNHVSSYEVMDIRSIDGEAVVGERFMEFYPDQASLQQTVIDLFYEPVAENE